MLTLSQLLLPQSAEREPCLTLGVIIRRVELVAVEPDLVAVELSLGVVELSVIAVGISFVAGKLLDAVFCRSL
jgi:hypothetical protein